MLVDPRSRPIYSHIDRDTYILIGPSHTFHGPKSLSVTCISVDLVIILVNYLIVYYFYYFYLPPRLSFLSPLLLSLPLFLSTTIKLLPLLVIHYFKGGRGVYVIIPVASWHRSWHSRFYTTLTPRLLFIALRNRNIVN